MIKAKAGTGARTSTLHAYGIRLQESTVSLKVHPIQRDAHADLVDRREVRSSTGRVTLRPVI